MESNYVIVVDSTTDLPPGLAEEWGLVVIPYIFNLDGKEYHNYLDYRELPVKDFYDTLRAGKTASTTQVTAHRYMETWEPFLKEGKDILYMCLSSQLSKSYDQSVMAAREAMEAYPDRKVITIDTKSACLGQGLLAYYAAKARDEGMSLEANAAYIEGLIPTLNHWVVPDDLHHLRRGGRVSGASAFVGTMLSIKPILTMLEGGKLAPAGKERGWSKALAHLLARAEGMNPKDQTVFIAHSDAPDKAKQIADEMTAKYGVTDFVINEIGPVIGAHTGPGTIAIMFLGDERVSA
ncbi:MAG: DegV family protein [Defluviitaleaceae bacterium]|jgi:DegV family protein with EDD domain|nr:DegV family protein [Defluviitaleaceae bacterium]